VFHFETWLLLKGLLLTQSPSPNPIISINKEYWLCMCLTVKRVWRCYALSKQGHCQKPAGIEEEPFSTEAID
jgi:hypothetical protein